MFNRGVVAQTGLLPEGQQLIQDVWPLRVIDKPKSITESVGGVKLPITRVRGIFQLGDEQNANGRVYPTNILGEAVEAIQEDLNGRAVWGEFDHPSDAKIHLDRISHLITKIWMEGKQVFGEAEIMEDLPFGKQLATLLRHGTIGISSRGIGDMEVRDNGGQETYFVTEGYRFVTWDAVAEPSVSGAILHITEGKLRPAGRKQVKPQPQNLVGNEHYQMMAAREFGELLKRR
jgi:hypothetical protein